MEQYRHEGLTFYERTLETIIFNMDRFDNSELKLLLLINRMTVEANCNAPEIRLKDFELITGLSRKTVLKGIRRLEDLNLIESSKDSNPHRYGINRKELFELSFQKTKTEQKMHEIISTYKKMEELHFEGLELPPEAIKLFEKWNKHFYHRLNITDDFHIMCIKTPLKTVSVEKVDRYISSMIKYERNKNMFSSDEMLHEAFIEKFGGKS